MRRDDTGGRRDRVTDEACRDAITVDDPFFASGPLFESDDPIEDAEIDDVVYGTPER